MFRGFVTRSKMPVRFRRAVTRLLDLPNKSSYDLARYLRYNVAVGQGWAIADAQSIADDTYPWDQYGFSFDNENTPEGSDCIAMNFDWTLVTPRDEPTLDLRAARELWFDDDTFDSDQRLRRRMDVRVLITVASNSNESLLEVLHKHKGRLGWNLQSKAEAAGRRLIVNHLTFSGKVIVREPVAGLLVAQIVPTDKYDPERLIAVFLIPVAT